MVQNLTIKERKFIKAYIANGNITQAVIDAGYSHKNRDVASTIGWRLLKKVRPHIAEVMEMRGIDDIRLSRVMDEGLKATKIEMIKDAGGNQKFGVVTDHYVRHKYLETALKVKGGFAPEKKEITGLDGGPVAHRFDLFATIERYKSVFESNGGKEGDSGGDGSGKPLDSP